ncbi:hypothetical protein NMG60_11025455 [Bertholletia excelsa]
MDGMPMDSCEAADAGVSREAAGGSAPPPTSGRGRGRGRGRTVRQARESTARPSVTVPVDLLTGLIAEVRELRREVADLSGGGAGERRQQASVGGQQASEDPHEFLHQLDDLFQILQCSEARQVQLTVFRLRGVARSWYDRLIEMRPTGAAPLTWVEFRKEFLERFMPSSRMADLTSEFERLVQRPGMSVTEYEQQFTRLSRYATFHVTDDRARATRFIRGLSDSLFSSMGSQIGAISYARAVECARSLEARAVSGHIHEGPVKRIKTDGSFSGSSSRARSPSRDHRRSEHGSSSGRQLSDSVTASGGHDSSGRQSVTCFRCGQQGHVIRHCPLSREVGRATGACFRCGQQGHVARDCSRELGGMMGGCYRCGQQGHLVMDCPISAETVLAAGSVPRTQGQIDAGASGAGGRGTEGGGRGRGHARVYALTYQDAQASDAAITGTSIV